MLLLTGPPGSGKTLRILTALRQALQTREAVGLRLLVPTATLAQHAQNELARQGFVFSGRVIQTLNAFIDDRCGDILQTPKPAFTLIVERAVRSLGRAEFANVLDFPGFVASLSNTIDEFSAAGCDSARLASHVPRGPHAAPLAEAFLAVYREVERELARRNLALRASRIEAAAQRIASGGAGTLRTVWLDGFHALPEPELHLISTLAKHADATIALSDFAAEGTLESLKKIGFTEERLPSRRARPATILVKAPNLEREAEEIARRILAQAADGRPFREMAVIVRAREPYLPILRSTFARFAIPARFYFPDDLEEHAAVRFLSGAIDAMLSNWDHARTLAALRLAPRFADSNAMDRFDFDVRERIPNGGLQSLEALAGDNEQLRALIASFAKLEDWRNLALPPRDWAARFQSLRNLFKPPRPAEPADYDLTLLYRSQSAALDAFDAAVDEASRDLSPAGIAQPVSLADFWTTAKSILRLTPLRVRDGRRNAVQVLSAHEARQWSLPVVFVCGLVERQFPQFHKPDPFFPEAARVRLNAEGIRVRTASGFEREEEALFHAAVSRGSSLAVLSYPEYDARGERNLPSIFLDGLNPVPEPSIAARPRPKVEFAPPRRGPISSPALLDYLRQKTATFSPSGLESYLQCAFQYFGTKTLRLTTAPKRPERRLNENYLLQGNIVHDVLKLAYADPPQVEEVFERAFEEARAELRIPDGYHTERLRNAMLEDLLQFMRNEQWPRAEFVSQSEEKFEFELDPALRIKGRIDRLDRSATGRAYVIDYKYSAAQRTKGRLKDVNLLQAPLYYLAARQHFGVEPDGVFYIGLKKDVEYVGWTHSGFLESELIPDAWLENARARTLQSATEIRAGRIEVLPANSDSCRFCDCRDVCRVVIGRGARIAAGGATA